jgi:hypothetical protein
MPTPADVRIFREIPMVISVLDYSNGVTLPDVGRLRQGPAIMKCPWIERNGIERLKWAGPTQKSSSGPAARAGTSDCTDLT